MPRRAGVPIVRGAGMSALTQLCVSIGALVFPAQNTLSGIAPTSDYIIIESIESLTVLNQYQEPLSPAERAQFLPYAPLAIKEADATIADGLTKAMKCIYGGRTYYVLRDETGKLVGDKGGLYRTKVRGCTVLEDTVELTAQAKLSRRLGDLTGTTAARGERLLRIFRHGNECYALRLGSQPQFGWCSWNTPWRKTTATPAEQNRSLSAEMHRRLRDRVEEVNALYLAYFEHFNRVTSKTKSVPQWKSLGDGSAHQWRITRPYDRTDELSESTDALVQEMTGMVIGTGYTVEFRNGVLAVKAADGR